jgi:phage shock protein PspC (stress-responsive transcriptional regulator)
MGQKLLRRSLTNRSIAGVCGGLADYLGIDATPLRIATLLLILFGGMSAWVYIILWLLIPEE